MIVKLRHYIAEREKERDKFVLHLSYPCNVQVHQPTKLPPLSLVISCAPHGPTAIPCPMPPDVCEIDSSLAYRLRPIHKTALLNRMADTNSKNGLTEYKKDYDSHVQFEPRFGAGGSILVKRPSIIASAADGMPFEGYANHLLHSMGLYLATSAAR